MEIFELEVFQLLANLTYDKVIIVGDWNVYLDPIKDQLNYTNPVRYRAKTRNCIKSNMRVHSLVDIYRQLNEQSTEVTFKDKRGRNFVNDSINNINQELSTPNLTGLQIENLQEELQEMQIRRDDLE